MRRSAVRREPGGIHRSGGRRRWTNMYDAIVVGARCAGSPTAMLLARKGYRVLVVDRATFPSDTVSTHFVHAPGRRRAAAGGACSTRSSRRAARRSTTYSFDFGPFTIAGTPAARSTASRPRTPRGAPSSTRSSSTRPAQAGAEVRERFTVEEVLFEDGAVVGIRGHDRAAQSVVERARVVIGADGRNSLVAQAVGPEQYHEKPHAAVVLLHLLERTARRRLRDRRSGPTGAGPPHRRTTG